MFPRCDNQRRQVKKQKKRKHNPFYFLYGWLWLCVQASMRLCVTAVSCDVAMTTDYAQRDRLRVKNQPPLTKNGKSHGKSSGLKISVFWGKQGRRKVDIYVEGKKKGKTATHHRSKHSVIFTTGPLIRSALPVTVPRNTSAWREVRPETVSSLQPSPSPGGRNKCHQQPVNSHPLWLNGMM